MRNLVAYFPAARYSPEQAQQLAEKMASDLQRGGNVGEALKEDSACHFEISREHVVVISLEQPPAPKE